MSASAPLASSLSFSFRPPEPPRPAVELLADIRARGGRVHRMMQAPAVFVLTTDPALKDWLLDLGARLKCEPQGYTLSRDRDEREWDITLGGIPVDGSLWEAAV